MMTFSKMVLRVSILALALGVSGCGTAIDVATGTASLAISTVGTVVGAII